MKRKGQEEIVGFVLIIVMVAIVFLIFLGISVRNGDSVQGESSEIYQFLESSMEFTTDCALRFVPDYAKLGELLDECYSGSRCINGELACDVLSENLNNLVKSAWIVGEESVIKGYDLEIFYLQGELKSEVLTFAEGQCSSRKRGASYLSPAFPGTIESVFSLCYD